MVLSFTLENGRVAGAAVAVAGNSDLTTGPEAVLRQHLELHVHGVGPAAAKVLGLFST